MEQNKVEILEALNNEKMYSLRGWGNVFTRR